MTERFPGTDEERLHLVGGSGRDAEKRGQSGEFVTHQDAAHRDASARLELGRSAGGIHWTKETSEVDGGEIDG